MAKRAARVSAGLLMCRRSSARLEFLLVHPGGPFFARKDLRAWSIPKGKRTRTRTYSPGPGPNLRKSWG